MAQINQGTDIERLQSELGIQTGQPYQDFHELEKLSGLRAAWPLLDQLLYLQQVSEGSNGDTHGER